MTEKLVTVMVGLLLIGAGLLGLRQYRQTLRHDMTRIRQQMNDTRHAIWDRHVKIAERVSPDRLRELIKKAGLELEPITPTRERTQPTGRSNPQALGSGGSDAGTTSTEP